MESLYVPAGLVLLVLVVNGLMWLAERCGMAVDPEPDQGDDPGQCRCPAWSVRRFGC